jgi:outer membrane protein
MNRTTLLNRSNLLPLLVALGTAFSGMAQAQSLVELFDAAKSFDATYQSARSQAQATIAKGEQARAGLLPSVGLDASATQSSQDSSLNSQNGKTIGIQSAKISAKQPLFNLGNSAVAEQGKKSTAVAQFQLQAAEQDLIVRVSQAYFDVLASTDSLTTIRSLKAATSEQLASAKRNFEVGTSTIVDTRDAQARFDLVVAQELAAENDLRVKSLALDQLVGKSGTAPKPLRAPLQLPAIQPEEVGAWVQQSEANNPAVQQAQIALEVAQLETQKAEAGHKPTLDLIGSYGITNNTGGTQFGTDYSTNVATVGLTFNLPLFAGYAIQNRVKETLALEDKARADLDAAKRSVAQGTRTAFFGVQSGMSQVKAYEAAETSTQSALDANKLGYQVGVKINIDVLNAQSQLFDTKAKLAKARYDVLVGGLKLRQASGVLKVEDLQPINAQLAP